MRRRSKPRQFEFPSMQDYWAGKKRLAAITDAAPQHVLASLLKEKLWEYDKLSAFHDYLMETMREMRGRSSGELRQWLLDAGAIGARSAYESLRPRVMRAIKQERVLEAGRKTATRRRAERSEDRKARAKRVAFDYLQSGHWSVPVEDIWAHVALKIGGSPNSARRMLGPRKALQRDAREDLRRDQERRAKAGGGLR